MGRVVCTLALAAAGCTIGRGPPDGGHWGSPCSIDSECGAGLDCVDGSCQPRRGAACASDADCLFRLACNRDGRCEEECGTPVFECSTPGFVCSVYWGACQAPVPAGTPCTYHEDCDDGYACSAAQAYTCQPVCRRADPWLSCGAAECCPDGTPCDREVGCPSSVYRVIDTCMRTRIGCEENEICLLTDGGVRRCMPRCEENAECLGATLCLPDPEAPSISTCSYGGTIGYDGPCIYGLECASGLVCAVDGRCRYRCDLPDGEPCPSTSTTPHVCMGSACVPEGP